VREIAVEERWVEGGPGGYRTEAGKGDTLTLRYRWAGRWQGMVFLVGFTLFWDAGVALAVWSKGFPLFMLFHAAVACGLSYICLAGLVDRTVITASRTRIVVRTGPVPIERTVELDPRDVLTFDFVQLVRETRRARTVSYALCAVTRTGERVQLSAPYSDIAHPGHLAAVLRRWMGRPKGEAAAAEGGGATA
jgi:hypothetical protein